MGRPHAATPIILIIRNLTDTRPHHQRTPSKPTRSYSHSQAANTWSFPSGAEATTTLSGLFHRLRETPDPSQCSRHLALAGVASGRTADRK